MLRHKPIKFIWDYCENLQTINFFDITFDFSAYLSRLSHFFKLFQLQRRVFRNVTNVKLQSCNGVTDRFLMSMFNLQMVTDLTLIDIEGLRGDFLADLQNIKKLELHGRRIDIRSELFVAFCVSNTQLCSLKIPHWQGDVDCLQGIVNNLKNLEELEISYNPYWFLTFNEEEFKKPQRESYFSLMNLPKIKDLTLHQEQNSKDDVGELVAKIPPNNRLESLCIKFSNMEMTLKTLDAISNLNISNLKLLNTSKYPDTTLERISCIEGLEELHLSCMNFNSSSIEMLIKRCRNMRYINVRHCKGLSLEFIPRIMKHLEGRRHRLVIDIKNKYSDISGNDLKGTYDTHLLELIYEK